MRLYNTLTDRKEEFVPAGPQVRMYVCGVTPYAPAHIGHAMSAVVFDVLRRYLEFKGYHVLHVQNFTDVDDKMIQAALHEGVGVQELAERNIAAYLEELRALNVLPAHRYPRATQEIPTILRMVSALVEKGFAYPVDGDVYFRVRRYPGYGQLSHRDLEGLKAGARVEVDERKEDVLDFALWKAQKPGEPAWDSPWGKGRPGWHIECSAMCLAYLGETVDIHGGGQDLIFPHHENEIAQSEAYTGKTPFVRYWVHNGLLRMGADKMSKSLGNIVPISQALERFSPDALRLFFLSSHYRSPLTYSDAEVEAQERALERILNALRPGDDDHRSGGLDPAPYRRRFCEAMDDDLNTPRARAVLFDLAREINRAREEGRAIGEAQGALRQLAGVLGLRLEAPEVAHRDIAPFIEVLVETRGELRKARQYELADRIRDRLEELGVILEDTPSGTRWRLKLH